MVVPEQHSDGPVPGRHNTLSLCRDLFSEQSAHCYKALLPCDVRLVVDVRGVSESPGAVVQEPEQRVADGVVEAVIGASGRTHKPRRPACRETASDEPVVSSADGRSAGT